MICGNGILLQEDSLIISNHMKRIVIICEGETEQEFCDKSLSNHFNPKDIYIQAPRIKHSNGGIVRWDRLKRQIETTLREDRQAYATLLIDYYGLYEKYKFPGWDEAQAIVGKNERMDYLEEHMKLDIDEELRHRFIPYIQLHEFEGLLFCDVDVFRQLVPPEELKGLQELTEAIENNPNPEMINNSHETSPSHRLLRIIEGYNKIVYGNIIAETIGLDAIRSKCPRFNNWIATLENV